ncbi:MAG: amino acid adenylation domain-containing protein [Vicinamibacterales bacterium]
MPLSFAQERFWFLEQVERGSGAYNTFLVAELTGPLDIVALQASVREIVRRHEVLRTAYEDRAGEPVAVLDAASAFDLQVVDLRNDPRSRQVRGLVEDEIRHGFDLERAPLVRAVLYRLADKEQWLAVTLHHIASDLWSMAVLIRELASLYGAFAAGEPSPLADLPVQYADFAAWQREWFATDHYRQQLGYWRELLADGVPPLQLPADRPRGPVRRFRGDSVSLRLPADLLARAAAFGRHEGVTFFMTSLVAFGILLSRYSGQTDFAVGCPVANRRGAETHRLIGCFVNTLVLRCRVSGSLTVRALLQQIRETCLGAYTHQDLPFERLADELKPPRDGGHSPFFQAMLSVNDQHDPAAGRAALATTLDASGLRLTPVDFSGGRVPADLILHVDVRADGLNTRLDYDTDLFDRSTADGMASHFGALLDAVITAPDRRVLELPVLSAAGREAVLALGRGRRAVYPDVPLHVAFTAQALRTPTGVAVCTAGEQVTYGELAHRATRLARELARRGVGPDTTVALLLDRSIDLVVAMLAVLEAGAAYMPLDLAYPDARLAFMLRDARVLFVVTQTSLLPRLPAFGGQVVHLDRDMPAAVDVPGAPEVTITPDHVAYVMYTSGSTGEPKGVQVPHRGVLRLLHGVEYVEIGPEDCLLQLASLAFDAATFEIWGALLHGARLALSPERVLTPAALGDLLASQGVTILWLTASLFNTVIDEQPEALRGVRQLLIGGEALSVRHVRRALAALPDTRIINGYGPTESTTFACCYQIPRTIPDTQAAIPIGPPIANTTAYVLDERLEPVPIGVRGALYLGGDGLARGYLHRPGLTAERFVPDPFSSVTGARLYRTGDLARLRAGGAIDFLGRLDGQVKVRGFRIEPGEVEAALVAHPRIKEAAAAVREIAPDDHRLVAYIVTIDSDDAFIDELRQFLRGWLPEYAVPSRFVALPALPLTSTGKLNRRALPAPVAAPPPAASTAPRTSLEEAVLDIWRSVLQVEHVGLHDNFFDRGGHSLLATRVVSRIRQACGVEVPLRGFFAQPTVAGLAQIIESLRPQEDDDAPPLEPMTSEGEVPLSFAQQRLWFLEQLDPGNSTYVIPIVARLRGRLDVEALRQSFETVVCRHSALRTTFHSRDGQPIAIVQPPAAFRLQVDDLTGIPDGERQIAMRRQVAAEARRPVRLDESPLIRARLLRVGATHHVLLAMLHHIVADGWSVAILLRELGACYRAARMGGHAALEALPIQYSDYAAWQRTWLQNEVLERQVAYWRTRLHGAETLRLPADRLPRRVQTFAADRERFRVPRPLAGALADISRARGVTLFTTLLAAFQTLLARCTGQTDITVGTPVAGRVRLELEPLIGLFVNTLALRGDLSGNPRFSDLLIQLRDVTLDAYAHQDVPFERVIEALQPVRGPDRTPIVQAMIVLQNTPATRVTLPGLRIRDIAWEADRAKFDLTLALAEIKGEIAGAIEYNTDLFSAATIHGVIRHFQALVRGIASNPDCRIGDLPLVSDEERRALVAGRRGPSRAVGPLTLHEGIERQAARTPFRPAIVSGTKRIGYRTLDRRANALAQRLREAGVGAETRVALLLDRSVTLVTAILAVLKAGGACVPLDPVSPAADPALVLADARPTAILTARRWLHLAAASSSHVICLDEDAAHEQASGPAQAALPDSLAYVLYAAGTGGRLAGAGVTHRHASAFVRSMRSIFSREDLSAVLASSSIAGHAAVFELFAPLSAGGTVVLVENLTALAHRPVPAPISLINASPSAMRDALRAGRVPASVRVVTLAGEPLTGDLVAALHGAAGRRVFHLYAPPTAPVYATCGLARRDAHDALSIGRPLANMQVQVVDARLEPVPPCVVGEILVAGGGLMREYCGEPALTAERLVPHPGEAGGRWARTGDLGRYRPDGTLELIERRDDRVETCGFRIALVEAHVRDHPDVAEAAVVPGTGSRAGRLVAYVVMREAQADAARIRRFLEERLPADLVPCAIVRLSSLPRFGDGSIDRRALPPLLEPNATRGGPPRTPVERALAGIWRELLSVESVGRETDFFDAGAHSLLATQLVARVRRDWHVDLPLKLVFQHPTIAGLAQSIEVVRWAAEGAPIGVASDAEEELSL